MYIGKKSPRIAFGAVITNYSTKGFKEKFLYM